MHVISNGQVFLNGGAIGIPLPIGLKYGGDCSPHLWTRTATGRTDVASGCQLAFPAVRLLVPHIQENCPFLTRPLRVHAGHHRASAMFFAEAL
ncbi:hypothetical protein [Limnobacter thiooxidans]|uniref:hypothetical protein n=1 Tax=Limnobacter thiooxidans TaxID=131080 RepID=UPI0030C6D018